MTAKCHVEDWSVLHVKHQHHLGPDMDGIDMGVAGVIFLVLR
jgi:hypothetical protein